MAVNIRRPPPAHQTGEILQYPYWRANTHQWTFRKSPSIVAYEHDTVYTCKIVNNNNNITIRISKQITGFSNKTGVLYARIFENGELNF